ncbi:MAG: hypothetical protein ACXADS_09190 [Candidatus Thorarchaeota archaeon]
MLKERFPEHTLRASHHTHPLFVVSESVVETWEVVGQNDSASKDKAERQCEEAGQVNVWGIPFIGVLVAYV